MKTFFISPANRRAASAVIATFIAFIFHYFYGYSEAYWLWLTAFIVSQTTVGTPLKQGVIYFLVIMLAVALSALLTEVMPTLLSLSLLLGLILISSRYLLFTLKYKNNQIIYLTLFFSFILLVATFPLSHFSMQQRMMDIVLGALIGIACTQFIFTIKPESAFREGMIDFLQYLNELSEAMTNEVFNTTLPFPTRNLSRQFPDWIYETGFNPALRSGFRFFLLSLEKVTDLFFSIHYLLSKESESEALQPMKKEILDVMHQNTELLKVLLAYFEGKRLPVSNADFTTDITQLENVLQVNVPSNLELLDISPHYLKLTALVRDIKDIRQLLLQLMQSLPNEGYLGA